MKHIPVRLVLNVVKEEKDTKVGLDALEQKYIRISMVLGIFPSGH